MDLDCFGSLVLGKYLHPDAVGVKSRLVHPVAKALYNLYKRHLNLMSSKDLKDQHVDQIIVFDTRSKSRIREYLEMIPGFHGDVTIYDHHINDTSDIKDAKVISASYGANTTLLALELMEKDVVLNPVDATIALTGIFADTGNFTHENVTLQDFQASSWLMAQGANMKLVSQFLKPLKQDYQISLFHQVLNRLVYKKLHGHTIILSYFEMKEQVSGLAPIVEKVFEVENADAIFILFGLEKARKTLIIGRSQKRPSMYPASWRLSGEEGIPEPLQPSLKESGVKKFMRILLSASGIPWCLPVTAEDIMTTDVDIIRSTWTVLDASLFLEKVGHTGAPVLNDQGEMCGFMTLRDISKARRADQMKAPVKGYMIRNVHFCDRTDSVKDLEKFFLKYNVGHIPVLENRKLLGIVTRTDYLHHIELR